MIRQSLLNLLFCCWQINRLKAVFFFPAVHTNEWPVFSSWHTGIAIIFLTLFVRDWLVLEFQVGWIDWQMLDQCSRIYYRKRHNSNFKQRKQEMLFDQNIILIMGLHPNLLLKRLLISVQYENAFFTFRIQSYFDPRQLVYKRISFSPLNLQKSAMWKNFVWQFIYEEVYCHFSILEAFFCQCSRHRRRFLQSFCFFVFARPNIELRRSFVCWNESVLSHSATKKRISTRGVSFIVI